MGFITAKTLVEEANTFRAQHAMAPLECNPLLSEFLGRVVEGDGDDQYDGYMSLPDYMGWRYCDLFRAKQSCGSLSIPFLMLLSGVELGSLPFNASVATEMEFNDDADLDLRHFSREGQLLSFGDYVSNKTHWYIFSPLDVNATLPASDKPLRS